MKTKTKIAVGAIDPSTLLGSNAWNVRHVKREIAVDLKQDFLNGYVDALMHFEFHRRYPTDKYPDGISIKVDGRPQYITNYREMEHDFTSPFASRYASGEYSTENPITQKLYKEGSALRKEITENLDSRLMGALGLGAK